MNILRECKDEVADVKSSQKLSSIAHSGVLFPHTGQLTTGYYIVYEKKKDSSRFEGLIVKITSYSTDNQLKSVSCVKQVIQFWCL